VRSAPSVDRRKHDRQAPLLFFFLIIYKLLSHKKLIDVFVAHTAVSVCEEACPWGCFCGGERRARFRFKGATPAA
jgi:hypothetical protein